MNEPNNNQRLSWRVPELAKSSGISEELIRKHIREGKLAARKIGTAVIILHPDVLAYLGYNSQTCTAKS